MLRVLDECDNVAADFSADPVHDLRVTLRRCRSMADGMMAIDPDPAWKSMKKAGRQLFQRLGALRDVQIMMEWIERLELHLPKSAVTAESLLVSEAQNPALEEREAPPGAVPIEDHDPAARALLQILRARETQHKYEARGALQEFDRKQWRHWSKTLPVRAARIRPGSTVFKHLALERWTTARELHSRAMRTRSQVALHTLRIGIKRFRYIVENFLPDEHKLWSNDLKHMQDLLGEVHDLDVLWVTALQSQVFPDEALRKTWHQLITEERSKRIDEYRKRTTGPDSLWNIWRAGLPQGKQVQEIATRRMKLWAKALDPDFAHSERVARLSLQLYDGLLATGVLRSSSHATNGAGQDLRRSLYAAALLHDVGKAKGNKGHQKESLELIKRHGTLLGWNEAEMQRAGLVARFHSGALPQRRQRLLQHLPPADQRDVIHLAGILRLANAFDSAHDGHVRSLRIQNGTPAVNGRRRSGSLKKPAWISKNDAVIIAAEGYREGTTSAQAVAAERYLLETVLRRPIIVRPAHMTRHTR